MTLRDTTRDIIKLVETKSSIPVRVTQDPRLRTIATVRMARKGSVPTHLIVYKPNPGETPDYQICFECGYILRLFSNPPEKRFDIADTLKGREEVENMMTVPGGVAVRYQLQKSQIEEMRSQFLDGLIVHLRSVPVGLRVSEYLEANFPTLEQLEKEHVQKEFKINRKSLESEIKAITPLKIFRAAQAITAAYTLYWSEKYGKPQVFNVYRLEGFEEDARALLDIYEQMPDDPTFDQALIDAWGKYLGLTDWYKWLPYQPPM
ncbi:MAG: hypothetical protein ABSE06_01335 [Anaerolineaceae bacterium]